MLVPLYTVPSITISGDVPKLGKKYTLICEITDSAAAANNIMYQWSKQQDTTFNVTGHTLSFSPLQLSHAGLYICHTTINTNSYYKEHKLRLKSTVVYDIYIQLCIV